MDVSRIQNMKTEINNRQNKYAIDIQAMRAFLAHISSCVMREDGTVNWKEISLVLLDDDGIAAVNQSYFNKFRPTDVISFRYAPAPEDEGMISGEVLVNVQRAHEEGHRRGDRNAELALYIAHGCLHLTGADDRTSHERAAMSRKQLSWIREMQTTGILSLFSNP